MCGVSSGEVREIAADGPRDWLRHGSPRERCSNGVLQIVARWPLTIDADVRIPVIDAAAIDEPSTPVEHCGLRRNRRSGTLDQIVPGILNDVDPVTESLHVVADGISRVVGVRKNQQESDALSGEFFLEPLNLRGVAVRDWAINAGEDQDTDGERECQKSHAAKSIRRYLTGRTRVSLTPPTAVLTATRRRA